jgi:signal transduction histidine kinase
MLKSICLLALLLLLPPGFGQGLGAATLSQIPEISLNQEVRYWVDRDGTATLASVSTEPVSGAFQAMPPNTDVLNLGFIQSPVWVRLTLDRKADASPDWIMEIPYLGINHADLYLPDGAVLHSGSLVPIAERPVFSRFYAFPITLGPESANYYLRVQSAYPISLPVRLLEKSRFTELESRENLLQFFYFGGLLSLMIYNFMLFIVIRDDKYLIYSFFTLFTGLGIFAGNGYASIYLWPDSPTWDALSQSVLLSIASGLAVLFSTRFLRTRRYLPKTHRFLQIMMWLYAGIGVMLTASLWRPLPLESVFQGLFLLTLTTPVIVLAAGIRNIRYHIQSSRYFLAAWGVLCVGVFVSAARIFGLLPSNGFTLYALQISSGLEMLLFSLALAYRFQRERAHREQAQNALIAAQEETLHALQVSEERLEKAVDHRTQKLQKLLLSEQHMRSQYTRFCAMIAHEFRNPLNVIQAQATMLDKDACPTPEKNHERIEVIRGGIGRLVTLFDQWLANDRVNMSIDQLQLAKLDLAPWLEEIVDSGRIYYNQHQFILQPSVTHATVLADKHLLEIALLNLMDNACKYSAPDSAVTIRLLSNNDELGILVSDQGRGIDGSQIRQILEPYVRAAQEQPSPDGIGLGLAFVDKIMTLHNGRIDIDSILGKGCAITLWLPAYHAPSGRS